MPAPIQLSDEELYQQLGSWEAAAAARDAQNNALNQYNWTQGASEAPASNTATPNLDDLVNQILGQNLTGRWSGEGFGSAQQNAADMAKILADVGITNINQFGKITKTIPGYSIQTEQGEEYVPEQKVDTYGNKVTGQEVGNTYGERQTGNFFGGTYAGKGNTGYGVQFDAQGNPYFYTSGASSNDLATLFADDPILGAAAQAAAGYFGGPIGTAALNALMGKDPIDIAKAAALSYAGNQVAQGISGSTDVSDLFGKTGTDIAAKTAGQIVGSGGKVDPLQALVTSGVGAGTNAVTAQIPEFGTLPDAAKSFVNKAISTAVVNGGNLSPNQLMNLALSAGKQATSSLKSSLAGFEANPEDFIEGYFQPGGEGYLDLGSQDMTVREEPENLDALLRSLSPYGVDGGTSIFTQPDDIPEMETVSNRPITSLDTILGNPDILQTVEEDIPEVTITDKKDDPYVPSIRTKEIKSDIPDQITADQIDKLFPNININDILQTVTPTKQVATPAGKTTVPAGTKSTQQLMANLGLGGGQQAPIQDPYAHIKLMEEMFGPDIAYKLTSPTGGQNLASADLDALARLLRG